MTDQGSRPPRVGEWLLRRLIPDGRGEEVAGDLSEEYAERAAGARFGATLWYWRQVLAISFRFGAESLRRTPELLTELRRGARQIRRRPGYSLIVIVALALGIGVNAVVLSVADAIFLEALPYPHHDRLAVLTMDFTGSATGNFGISYPNYREAMEQSRTVEESALMVDWESLYLAAPDGPRRMTASMVTPSYFRLLGLRAALGRGLEADDDGEGTFAPVAVLSHGAWQRRFGGDPEILGRTVVLNDQPFEVVGVLEPGATDLRARNWTPSEVFLPLRASLAVSAFEPQFDERGDRFMNPLVRVREGLDMDALRQELAAISRDLARRHPETNEGWSFHVTPVTEAFFDDVRAPALVLVAGSLLVLILVAVNLTNLVVVRSVGRSREMAVRRALGAGGGRLLRQLLAESLVLAVAGGALGLLLATWGAGWVMESGVAELPAFADAGLDGRVLAASFFLTVAVGVILGVVPALSFRKGSVAGDLREGRGHSAGPGRASLQSGLVVAEVALAFVVLVGAGLMVESFRTLRSTGYGFDTDGLLTTRMEFRGERYEEEGERERVARVLMDRAGGLPGVRDAFLWSPNPLGQGNWVELLTRRGRFDTHPEERLEASRHSVHPGTLERLGIPLLRGRDVGPQDTGDGHRVLIMSESLAEALFPGEDAVGKWVESGRFGGTPYEVIGIAADARHRTRLFDPFGPQWDVYFPYRQESHRLGTLVLRLGDDASVEAVVPALRSLISEVDPNIPLFSIQTMAERMQEEESRARLSAALVGLYAVLAMILAALGVYGVLSHGVRQRTRELGIRTALGADARSTLVRVVFQGMRAVVVGLVLGAVAALALSRLLRAALYGVSPWDPGVFVSVAALLPVVALVACLLPARRAVTVDPTVALRAE